MQSRNLEENYWEFIVGCTHSLCKLKLGYSFHAVAKKSEKQRHEMKLHRACRTIVCVKWDCFFMWFLLIIIYLLLISVAPYCTNLTQQYNATKLCISNHCYRLPYTPYCSHQTKFFYKLPANPGVWISSTIMSPYKVFTFVIWTPLHGLLRWCIYTVNL